MRILLVLGFLLASCACTARRAPNRISIPVIAARISYVFELKAVSDSMRWPGFNALRYEVPLIYYTDDASYVANPTPKLLKLVRAKRVYQDSRIVLYKTRRRLDERAFHMATGFESGDPDSARIYNHNEPFMACSGFEETNRKIPDVRSLEQWATMVIHEYFHGFQYKHAATFALTQHVLHFGSDSLRSIYKRHSWFKAGIDAENVCLLDALAAATDTLRNNRIGSFFRLRNARREAARKQFGFDLAPYETYYELMEGTARYTEFGLYQYFSSIPPEPALAASDTAFKHHAYFRNYNMEADPWLYLTEKTSYFYATGFNMARLLDLLGIPFKATVFDRERSLEALLQQAR